MSFSIGHMAALREIELSQLIRLIPAGAKILELGAGTGHQTLYLRSLGFNVTAIDIPESNYSSNRIVEIQDYDGRNIPFEDFTFDIVFSSNVLEHVPDLTNMHSELRRVLRTDGVCIHVMPTHVWRIWQTLGSYPLALVEFGKLIPQLFPRGPTTSELRRAGAAWSTAIRRCGRLCLPRRHGERGNTLTETFYFHPAWWRKNFKENGFRIVEEVPLGLFYTGHMLLGESISPVLRSKIAKVLGSVTRLYLVKPQLSSS